MRNKVLYRFLVLALLIVAGTCTYLLLNKQPDNTVALTDLYGCSSGISREVASNIEEQVYGKISLTNDYNKLPTAPSYTGSIRAGTCSQKQRDIVTGIDGSKQSVFTSSGILDVPAAKMSWSVTYSWVRDGEKINVDLGAVRFSCLPHDELLYGDFDCEKVENKIKYGTDNYDPILQYMPYSGLGFDLKYDDKTKKVTALIYIPEREKNNQELIQNDKAIVPDWFTERNLDINKYVVEYVIEYQ